MISLAHLEIIKGVWNYSECYKDSVETEISSFSWLTSKCTWFIALSNTLEAIKMSVSYQLWEIVFEIIYLSGEFQPEFISWNWTDLSDFSIFCFQLAWWASNRIPVTETTYGWCNFFMQLFLGCWWYCYLPNVNNTTFLDMTFLPLTQIAGVWEVVFSFKDGISICVVE